MKRIKKDVWKRTGRRNLSSESEWGEWKNSSIWDQPFERMKGGKFR